MATPERCGRMRGATLVEALVCLLVLALGLVAGLHLQASSRLTLLTAHERGAALRAGLQALEQWRSGQSVPPSEDTTFEWTQHQQTGTPDRLQVTTLRVQWLSRSGRQEVQDIHAMSLPMPAAAAVFRTLPSPASPLQLTAFSPSRLPTELTPTDGGPLLLTDPTGQTWTVHPSTELLEARCIQPSPLDDPPAPDAVRDAPASLTPDPCEAIHARWISGYIRGAAGVSALLPGSLHVQFHQDGFTRDCVTRAVVDRETVTSGGWQVAYTCVIPVPNAQAVWSGHLTVRRATTSPRDTVCRARFEQPAHYDEVQGVLSHQNFWLVPTGHPCPLPPTHNGGLLNHLDLLHDA